MAELVVRFDVRFGSRAARGLMAAVMFFAAVPELASESVTLTTYYPAPSGVYAQMITTGNTYLARDGGAVRIGNAVPPAYELDVVGDIHSTGWVRTDGAAGWYSQTYGGGWYMQDATWIRSYNAKPVYMSNGYDSGTPSGAGCGGGLGGGYMFDVCGTENVTSNLTVGGNVTAAGTGNIRGNLEVGPGVPAATGRGYLYIDNTNTACYATGAGGNAAVCPAGYFASFQPGLFIEGWTYENTGGQPYVQTPWGNSYQVWANNAGATGAWGLLTRDATTLAGLWCCPK